jgi:hypothetical protein
MIGGKKKGGKRAAPASTFTSAPKSGDAIALRSMRNAMAIRLMIALFVTLLVAVGLPIAYLVYLKRLEDQKCVCATSHELFQRLRIVVVVQLAFTVLLPLVVFLPKSWSMALSLVVSIVMASTFLVWFRDMATLKCMCTRGWEKNVWLVMSVLDVTFFVLYVIAAVMTSMIGN